MIMKVDTAYRVSFTGSAKLARTGQSTLRRAVKAALQAHGVKNARIGLDLVTDEEIALMNEQRLGHKGPTDVLTFDVREQDGDCIEGEIALSVDTARREGKLRGHGVEAELALYAVHGVLHLLGYKDKSKAAAAKMHAMEDQILESVGLEMVYSMPQSNQSNMSQKRQRVVSVGRNGFRERPADGSRKYTSLR